MLDFDTSFYFCTCMLLALLFDIIKRYRSRAMGIDTIYTFRGFLNFPLLACIGFISTVFVGWSGWIFGIISAIAVTEEVKIIKIDKEGVSNYDFFSNALLRLLVSSFLLSELILIGCLFRLIIKNINNIL